MKKKLSGIYQITCLTTGDFYLGQTIDLTRRKCNHFYGLQKNNHGNIHLQNAFNKYGEDAFRFNIILYCEPEELTYYEQKLVDILNPSYNIQKECVDSPKGIKHTEEEKKKISESLKGIPKSEEQKKKISESLIGNIPWNKGIPWSDEAKKKISEARKGFTCSEESNKKNSESHKGIHRSDETKKRISDAAKKRWANKKQSGVNHDLSKRC